ncbi:MAG: winged helix-turn-helix transcriptional regulator [Solirubrobacterales bacterium]
MNVQVLQALDGDPTPLPDLRRAAGHPPVTTMRSYLRRLTELDVIQRRREDDFPGSVSYTITKPGRKLTAVAEVLERWLQFAPGEPIALGSAASKSVVKTLVDGYSENVVRALAARPLALTELSRFIPQVSYPTLERRLTAMRQVGLIEPSPERNGRVTRYQATRWLRQAVAPMTAAVGWERLWAPEQTPAPTRIDVEAAFLLAVPLLDLPGDVSGACRLAVELKRGPDPEFAGVTVVVEDGEVRSCVSRLEGRPQAWATGSLLDWFRWLRNAKEHRIEIGGDSALARALAEGLQSALVSVPSV